MKKEVMTKWTKALRSGKYKQGKEFLKREYKGVTRHCCLGVLCELYNKEMKKNKKSCAKEKTVDLKERNMEFFFKFDNVAQVLPPKVRKWAGIKTTEGHLPRKYYLDKDGSFNGNPTDLTGANDDGKTFKTIANIIEKNWEGL